MMQGLTIGWEYLTGYAVATDPSSRKRAEWPPHPGRVFMAMAAAWFETGEDQAEGDALRWLETLGDPDLHLPSQGDVFERSPVTVYVPVNDKAGPAAATLQSAPAMTRSKQQRTFPCVRVGESPCFMVWSNAEGVNAHHEALERLCSKVTRIGHSSSLVRMWVADDQERDEATCERWKPDDATATSHCRVVAPGTLDALPGQTQIPRIKAFADLRIRIEDAEWEKTESKQRQDKAGQKAANQALKQAKDDYEQKFAEKWKASASPPPLLHPKLGLWSGYRQVAHVAVEANACPTHFDSDMLVLVQVAGPQLPVASTLMVTRALRGAVMSRCGIQPVPAWVSGHQASGERCEDDAGHMAYVPLPFVGHAHADGHLMGVGLVFPRSVDRQERGRVLGKLLLDKKTGQPKPVQLTLGRLGVWTVVKRDWSESRRALQPETWTAFPTGATTWASVTPVVLDRFPKADRVKDRAGWTDEVTGIIANACRRISLPIPEQIDIDTTSWHTGSPRAVGKRRPIREQDNPGQNQSAALGDGYPFFLQKGTNAPRPQVHVWLRFAQPVVGPVLLGAGRYRGYGLCKPLNCRQEGQP